MKKKLVALLTAVLVFASFAAPMAVVAEEDITISLLGACWSEYVENLERLVELYEAEHPNVTVEMTVDATTLTANIAAGNYPTVMVYGQFSQLEVFKEYLGDMTDNDAILSHVSENGKLAGTFDGRVYGIAVTTESDGLVYNKALLREAGFDTPPRTYDEMETLCAKLQEMGVTPFALGFGDGWIADHFLIYPFPGNEDLKTVSDKISSGEMKMADVEYCKEYQRYVDLVMANANDRIFETDYTTMLALLASGQCAMCTNGSWTAEMILDMNPDFELGIMGQPYSDDPADSRLNVTPSSCICYFKDSEYADEGVKFIEWMLTSEAGKTWLGSDFGVLTNIDGVTSDYDGLVMDTIAALDKDDTKLWGDTYFKNRDWNLMVTSFQKYVLGDCTWEEMWNTVGDDIAANAD